MKKKNVLALCECAVMITLATVLSILPLFQLPFGGSITVAQVFPIALIAYRYSWKIALPAAMVFSAIQLLFGLQYLSYAPTTLAIIAIIFLDYIIAFSVIAFAGAFKKKITAPPLSIGIGIVFACTLRFICHFIAGWTVWIGISIPANMAVPQSLLYNASYMLPETIICVITAVYVFSVLDFRGELVTASKSTGNVGITVLKIFAFLPLAGGFIYSVANIFSHLQNTNNEGMLDFNLISNTDFGLIGIVLSVCVFISALIYLFVNILNKRKI